MRKKLLTILLSLGCLFGTVGLVACDGEDDSGPSKKTFGSLCLHEYGTWNNTCPATCTSIGYETRSCVSCGAIDYRFHTAVGHVWDEGVSIVQETNEQDGMVLYGCAVCKSTKREIVKGASKGLTFEAIDSDSAYRVTGIGSCTDTEIIVPDAYNEKPVTEIGEKAFFGCKEITSIKLPETIVKIGDKAFSECENLEKASIPDQIEVGTDVFRGSIKVEIVVHHALTYVEAKEATCTEAGNIAYYWCEPCNFYYADKEGTIRVYEVTTPVAHDFVYGVCTKCDQIQNSVKIVEIDEVGHLGKFALGTLENAIGLPKMINVKMADGVTRSLPIAWNLATYDKSKVGEYTITGYIQSGLYHFEEGLSNQISTKVEIVEYMEGTADIVFVLDISLSMEDEIANVKNNIVAFSQALEEQGVSARWSVITYSDFTESGENERTCIVQNGATPWFASATDYKAAINGISLANGGDTEETAIDGLMAATTLENRKDARVFYILLTDAPYKTDNNYEMSSMDEVVEIFDEKGVNTSIITSTSISAYNALCETTGGIKADINGDFAQELLDALVPIIYEEVIA